MTFLPTGFKMPVRQDRYLKFVAGENRFRILSPAIFGMEEWIDKKPFRYRDSEVPAAPASPGMPFKHFMSCIVWNRQAHRIELLHVNQMSVLRAIVSLTRDPDWGDPFTYDIKVHRKGEGKETEYQVTPAPKTQVTPDIVEAFYATPIYLDALFGGGDPFGPHPACSQCIVPRPIKQYTPAYAAYADGDSGECPL